MARDRRAEIIHAARAILEDEGPEALTMRTLGERLGVKAPSLYKHVAGKDELEAGLITVALDELGSVLAGAIAESTGNPAEGLAAAYRGYALAHPRLYRLAMDPIAQHVATPFLQAAGDPDRALALWAFAHGMVQLELAGRCPPGADLDVAWLQGLAAFMKPAAQPRTVVRSWRGPD